MKKGILVFISLMMVTGSVFAESRFSLSAGVGGLFSAGTVQTITFGNDEYSGGFVSGGGYAFFDATYVEASLGVSTGSIVLRDVDGEISKTNLNIGVIGKYPFRLTEKFHLFPMLGINYSLALSVSDAGDPGDFSELWFQLGAGIDFFFTNNIFIRFSPLLGFRLPTKHESDLVNAGGSADGIPFGFTARLAVGYRF